jgi:hypothetical protein
MSSVYPSIDTLIGIGQKNSLNFIFSEYLVLQQISSFFIKLEQNMAGGIYNSAAYYFIYYAYTSFLVWITKIDLEDISKIWGYK